MKLLSKPLNLTFQLLAHPFFSGPVHVITALQVPFCAVPLWILFSALSASHPFCSSFFCHIICFFILPRHIFPSIVPLFFSFSSLASPYLYFHCRLHVSFCLFVWKETFSHSRLRNNCAKTSLQGFKPVAFCNITECGLDLICAITYTKDILLTT